MLFKPTIWRRSAMIIDMIETMTSLHLVYKRFHGVLKIAIGQVKGVSMSCQCHQITLWVNAGDNVNTSFFRYD